MPEKFTLRESTQKSKFKSTHNLLEAENAEKLGSEVWTELVDSKLSKLNLRPNHFQVDSKVQVQVDSKFLVDSKRF